jgi:ribosomal-protein-alanine N-acetyltransferase
MAILLTTPRLAVRDWSPDDAPAAFAVYGDGRIPSWLSPALPRIPDITTMRWLLEAARAAPSIAIPPAGRWALVRRRSDEVVGGVSLRLIPPYEEDLEIGWHLAPEHRRHGYASEAGRALAEWSFAQGADEVFTVVAPGNRRGAATARRIGMEWVGETDKYYERLLQVYRLRAGDVLAPVSPLKASVAHGAPAAR